MTIKRTKNTVQAAKPKPKRKVARKSQAEQKLANEMIDELVVEAPKSENEKSSPPKNSSKGEKALPPKKKKVGKRKAGEKIGKAILTAAEEESEKYRGNTKFTGKPSPKDFAWRQLRRKHVPKGKGWVSKDPAMTFTGYPTDYITDPITRVVPMRRVKSYDGYCQEFEVMFKVDRRKFFETLAGGKELKTKYAGVPKIEYFGIQNEKAFVVAVSFGEKGQTPADVIVDEADVKKHVAAERKQLESIVSSDAELTEAYDILVGEKEKPADVDKVKVTRKQRVAGKSKRKGKRPVTTKPV